MQPPCVQSGSDRILAKTSSLGASWEKLLEKLGVKFFGRLKPPVNQVHIGDEAK